jgi:hypothetical protein
MTASASRWLALISLLAFGWLYDDLRGAVPIPGIVLLGLALLLALSILGAQSKSVRGSENRERQRPFPWRWRVYAVLLISTAVIWIVLLGAGYSHRIAGGIGLIGGYLVATFARVRFGHQDPPDQQQGS